MLFIITKNLFGSGWAITTSILSILNPSAGIKISDTESLLASIAILITKEYISKLKIRYTKFRDWINVITLFFEKTLKQSMVDKKNRGWKS